MTDCSHPNARLYQHGTQAVCPDCKQRNNRISHYNDGNWMAMGRWFTPKVHKETRWTDKDLRNLRKTKVPA